MKKISILILLFLISIKISTAQETYKRTFGLATSIQNGDIGLQIPIWVGTKTTVAPYLSVMSISDSETDIVLGVIPKFYLNMNKLAPYTSIRFGAAFNMPSDDTEESTTDFITGFSFGGDYFFDPRFCIGVEGQLNLSISDDLSNRFGNPGGSNLNTAMMVTATVFFGK